LCVPSYYGTGDECDCGCGALDADCADASFSSCFYNGLCDFGGIESQDLQFVVPESPTECLDADASGWRCPADIYDVDDGCDCGCGYFDPDCEDDSSIEDCNAGLNGCQDFPGAPAEVDPEDTRFCLNDDNFLTAGWRRRWSIDIDTSGVTENIEDVPIGLILDPGAEPGIGAINIDADLRFVRDGVELAFDVEKDSVPYVIWVKLPLVRSGSSTHRIFMYGDNGSVEMSYDPQAHTVWSAGYEAVFHFSPTGRKNAAEPVGSTSPQLGYTLPAPGVTQSTGTLWGEALSLDGSSGLAMTTSADSGIPLLVGAAHPGITAVVAYFGDLANGDVAQIVNVSQTNTTASRFNIYLADGEERLRVAARDGVGGQGLLEGEQIPAFVTTQVSATSDYTADTLTLYVNGGVAATTNAAGVEGSTPTSAGEAASFGSEDNQLTTRTFQGIIDEVRIFDAERSDSFMWMEHRALTTPFPAVTPDVNLNE